MLRPFDRNCSATIKEGGRAIAITPRKQEVTTVMEAIEDATSLEDTAKRALKASYAALQQRPGPGEKLDKGLWAVVVEGPRLYGPFGTHNEAERALMNGKIPNFEMNAERLEEDGLVAGTGERAMILPMMGSLAMAKKAVEFDREARLFSNHLCSNCERPQGEHDMKSSRCPDGSGNKLKTITL